MKYKFVSKEQARNDWENGRVQIEHNQAGKSEKLIKLLEIVDKHCTAIGSDHYYWVNKYGNWSSNNAPNNNLPSVPTDELWEMIFGEYQQEDLSSNLSKIQDEIIGLNGRLALFERILIKILSEESPIYDMEEVNVVEGIIAKITNNHPKDIGCSQNFIR